MVAAGVVKAKAGRVRVGKGRADLDAGLAVGKVADKAATTAAVGAAAMAADLLASGSIAPIANLS